MTNLITYPGYEVIIKDVEKTENNHIYDSSGKRYVDLEAGVWCISVGHQHPRILEVINKQFSKTVHLGFNYSSNIVEQAAGDILDLLGFNQGKCVFLCSGSEAVEYSVRGAQMVTHRPLMLTMADSYFGAYGSANKKDASEWHCFDWFGCGDCSREYDCTEGCDRFDEIPFDDLGGFLFEPGSSSGLVRFPPEKLIKNIVARIKAEHGFVLVNEVTVGIGRTGEWFGYQHYGIRPDIVAMGKGIGNGYPVSVAAFSSEVIDCLGGRPVMYSQSHQNDALGAAIVREVIRIIRDEHLIEKCRRASELLWTGLNLIKSQTKRIKEIRMRGLMCAVELHDDPETVKSIYRSLIKNGYVLIQRPGTSMLRLDPILNIEPSDIEGFLKTFDAVLHGA